MAHLSGDDGLLSAFAERRDVHQATAAEVFGVPLDAVDGGPAPLGQDHQLRPDLRHVRLRPRASSSAFRAARRRNTSTCISRAIPGVKRYMDETRAQAKAQGYVETVFGRRLYLPDINARNKQLQQAAERAAINAPMQGTAADIIKRAMIAVDGWCGAGDRGARLIMQVHDELVLEVRQTARSPRSPTPVRERMMAAAALRVPLKVDVGTGANWDEAH